MSDPTKNLPWRVSSAGDDLCRAWFVRDSTGANVFVTRNEALARMVAAGSVAGELYAALRPFQEMYDDCVEAEGEDAVARWSRNYNDFRLTWGMILDARAVLINAAPLLDQGS